PDTAHAATPRRVGTPPAPLHRGPVTRDRGANPPCGSGARKAALCGASPTVPLAEPIPSSDSSAIQSPASDMVDITAYRHRVTLEALREIGTFSDAAAFGEIVFDCTNGANSIAALRLAGAANLRGKILIQVGNPLDFSKAMPPSLTVCNT